MSTLKLWPNAQRQLELAELLSRASWTLAGLAEELGLDLNDAGHILARLRRAGLPVAEHSAGRDEAVFRILYPAGRVCAAEGCTTILRRSNPSDHCELHGGGLLSVAQRSPGRPGGRRFDPSEWPAHVPRIEGSALRALREREGLTVRQLAAQVELDPGFVSKLERGRRPVTPAIAARLARKLGTTVLRR